MTSKVKQQEIAVFGESGSGKTVLLSSFFGATQEPSFQRTSLFKVVGGDTGQAQLLRHNYLKMRDSAQAPMPNAFAATRYSFVLNPKDEERPKAKKPHRWNALRLVWHDYPGEWFQQDPSSAEEAERRIETFRALLGSDVALVLVDGQKLLEYVGEEEKYLKSLIWGLRGALEKLEDDILVDGRLRQFPRIWVLALSKADLHPELDAQGFEDLVLGKAAQDLQVLRETLQRFVEVPEALSIGEDFMLLSSARFEPDKIEVTQRIGVDLIFPVACMLPLDRVAQWADKFNIPLKLLGNLVENVEELATLLATAATFAAGFIGRVPRVGPLLSKIAVPTLIGLVELSTTKLQEVYQQAVRDQDYLTATLAKFRLDLDAGVTDGLLKKSVW